MFKGVKWRLDGRGDRLRWKWPALTMVATTLLSMVLLQQGVLTTWPSLIVFIYLPPCVVGVWVNLRRGRWSWAAGYALTFLMLWWVSFSQARHFAELLQEVAK